MQEHRELFDIFKAAALIRRSVEGSLDLEEEALLWQWIRKSDSNESLYKRLLNEDYREEQLRQMQQFDTEKGWQNASLFLKRVPFHKRRTFRIAAVVTLFLGSALMTRLLWHHGHTHAEQFLVDMENDVPAGHNKAYLTFPGSKKIVLEDAKDSVFFAGNARVRQQKGTLSILPATLMDEPVKYMDLHTPNGGQYQLLLPDGTRVWLNAGSMLHFPDRFTGIERRVTLTGEAYFDVTHDPGNPFIVSVEGTEVQALGTAFNVKAYPGEQILETALTSGVVQLQNKGKKILLQPGKMATLTPSGVTVEVADITAITAWKDGLFLFRDTDMREVLRQLSRWYNVDIAYAPDFTPDSRFTARISRQVPLSRLLQMMEQTSIARFRLTGRTVTVLSYVP